MNISKIIIPAAGIGSRFLPITKSIPKEMLPLSNKPAIEHIVQEAFDAKLNNVGIILSPEKNIIKKYFEHDHKLDRILIEKNQQFRIETINNLIEHIDFSYYYQNKPAGVADALLQAKNFIKKDEFFAVAYPDDIIFGSTPEIAHLMQAAKSLGGMIIAVQEIPIEHISSYGVIAIKNKLSQDCYQVASLIEKPKIQDAPSNLAIVGRYIYHADLFDFISKTPADHTNEIILPQTINLMIQHGYPVFAVKIKGKRFDTGTPEGWMNYIIEHNNQWNLNY